MAKTLTEYKPDAPPTQKPVIQDLINLSANKCVHATLYVLYCVGKKCLRPTMNFCQSATTRNVGVFTCIPKDINTCDSLKQMLLTRVQRFDLSLIISVLDVGQNLFNFESVNKLKKYVMKLTDCNIVRPNNPRKNVTFNGTQCF